MQKKRNFVRYKKCSPSYFVYYYANNKVMKQRVVYFNDKQVTMNMTGPA